MTQAPDMRRGLLLALFLRGLFLPGLFLPGLVAGCGPTPPPDAGPSPQDGGAVLDAGPPDANQGADASFIPDAGITSDAGFDAGHPWGDAGLDAGPVDGGDPPPPGTFDNPIAVDTFPYSFAGDTTAAPSDIADAYTPCAPNTAEQGGEYVFVIVIPSTPTTERLLTITVDDAPGDDIDIDLHLLSAAAPDACIDRDNTALSRVVGADDVLYLAADTWTNGAGMDLAGPFTITMSLQDIDVENCLENPLPTCDENTFPLVNATPTEDPGVGGCPPGMTPAGEACVDRFEAMLVEVLPDQSLAPHSPYQNPGNKTVRALSIEGAQPQGYISGVQAAAACAEAGKRLCTNVEWLRACKGANDTTYPYGNTVLPGVCNDARTCHPAVQYFESNESWVFSELDHPCINQLPASVDDTGSNAGCVSDDGAYDMMGNLHEWTADPAGTFRGGFYVDTVNNGPGCGYVTTAHTTAHWDYSTGFRCCADLP